jgi:hypothetical protein
VQLQREWEAKQNAWQFVVADIAQLASLPYNANEKEKE